MLLERGHRLPVGIAQDPARLLVAGPQARPAALQVAAVDDKDAQKLLGKVGDGANRIEHGIVIAVHLEIPGQITAIARDVIARHVARGVELSHAADLFVGDLATAAEHVVGHVVHVGDLARHVPEARVIQIDEKTGVGQPGLLDHAPREEAALEAENVRELVALASAPAVARERVIDGKALPPSEAGTLLNDFLDRKSTR